MSEHRSSKRRGYGVDHRKTGIIQPSGGRARAAAIPGAELLEIDGIERTVHRSG